MHPLLPGKTLHGRTTFSWLESGTFLRFHMHIDEPATHDGLALLSTDDATPEAGAMLYFDVRNVSREYRWTISGNVFTWSRDAPGFSQRMVHTIAEDGQSIEAKGEMSRNGHLIFNQQIPFYICWSESFIPHPFHLAIKIQMEIRGNCKSKIL